jgi:tRNA A-37 threonylcarbamoyl transferase component Bud32
MSHATSPDLPAPGQSGTIAGYRLDTLLGRGSVATVYLAEDERQDQWARRRIALKAMAPELSRDTDFRTRMIRESRAAAALDHPHIIPVFEADEANGTLYVAMRYVPGGDARSLLGQLGPLPPGDVGRIIAQIASALDVAHAHGLIHRDVRPANILLDRDDEGNTAAGGRAYLADFGMSRAFTPGQIIAAEQAGGSLDYLAPEQIEGRALDGRADLYSLACTGFELMCGTPPFGPDQGPTLMYAQIYADPPAASAGRAGLPAAVDSVLATALAKDPADRYPSCGRFAEELRAALGVRPGERNDPVQPRQAPAVTGQLPAAGGSLPAVTGRLPAAGGSLPAVTGRLPAAGGGRHVARGSRPAVAAERPPAVRAQPTLVEEQPAAGPVPLGRGAPGEPGGASPGPSEPRRRVLRLVLAAAVIAVIAAAVSGVALAKRSAPAQSTASSPASRSPSPSSTGLSAAPSPSSTGVSAAPSPSGPVVATQQAAALGTLLTSSAAARTALHQAVTQVGACANLPGAASQLQEVVNQRSSEYGHASALATSALPGGAKVKSALVAALGRSLKADQDYLAWAREQMTGGCTPTSQSSAYTAAFSASEQADAAKQAFVQVWNPVAARYGIAQESPRDI